MSGNTILCGNTKKKEFVAAAVVVVTVNCHLPVVSRQLDKT